MKTSFLTGSRAYGEPRINSDIDLVVVTDKETVKLLREFSEHGPNGKCVFGKLNLVLFDCDDPEEEKRWKAWKDVTEDLTVRKPVSREDAVKEFKAAGANGGEYPAASTPAAVPAPATVQRGEMPVGVVYTNGVYSMSLGGSRIYDYSYQPMSRRVALAARVEVATEQRVPFTDADFEEIVHEPVPGGSGVSNPNRLNFQQRQLEAAFRDAPSLIDAAQTALDASQPTWPVSSTAATGLQEE